MSWLKDLYPCTNCKTPVRVHSRREIPEAICDPCMWRQRAISSIRWADEGTNTEAATGNTQKDERLLCLHWFKAMEHAMAAEHRALHALPLVEGRQRGKMALRLRSRLKYVRDILGQLGEYVDSVAQDALRLESLAGDPDAPHVPLQPRPPARLTLVRKDP